MALPVWGTYANILKQSLRLITFDFHADTHDPFAAAVGPHDFDYKKFEKNILSSTKYRIDDFSFEDVYKLSCDYVRNDEHILTAYKFEYINEYHIFCSLSDCDLNDYERWDRHRHIDAFYHEHLCIKNMTDEEIQELCTSPYILDFDLDYFTTPKIFDDLFIRKLTFLIQNAVIITIAKEPHYFNLEKSDPNFQHDEALCLLLDVINTALNNKSIR